MKVGIFTATSWEHAAVRRILSDDRRHDHEGARCLLGRRGRHDIVLVRTGVGLEKAAAAGRVVLREHRVDLAVSAGLAGALTPARIGDVLIGTDVRIETDDRSAQDHARRACAGGFVLGAQQAAAHANLPAHTGSFVTTPRILWHAADKRALSERTGAIGVDMESAALAGMAAGQAVPFTIIRHVSDLRDESLPVDLNLFMRPSGWLAGVAACLAAPSSLAGFRRLRAQMLTATDAMSRFFAQWMDELA
jgi:adenosylhomocysteine nucleosidase